MIAIQRTSKKADKNGFDSYQVSVTQILEDKSVARKLITTFKHRRENGMAVCMELAATAIKKYESEQKIKSLLALCTEKLPTGSLNGKY